jgi:hypothetical protein
MAGSAALQLDSRSPETACLMTTDGKNVMIVSYADLARALDASFKELLKAEALDPSTVT